MSKRDSQKNWLYAAERRAFTGTLWDSPIGDGSIEAAQAWLNAQLQSRPFQSRWGQRVVYIVPGSGSNAAYRGRIMLSRWGRRPWVILHELSHVLASSATVAAHGPEFAATYLTLVEILFGKEEAKTLRTEFGTKTVLKEGGQARRVRYRTGLASVPKPGTHFVETKAEREAKARKAAKAVKEREAALKRKVIENRQRLAASPTKRNEAAAIIRAAVAAGDFGPSGSKPRTHALATARALEKGTR